MTVETIVLALAMFTVALVVAALAVISLLYRDLRRAAETLCAACESEYGDGLDYGFADEETVAWSPADDCRITFGMVRRLRGELDR